MQNSFNTPPAGAAAGTAKPNTGAASPRPTTPTGPNPGLKQVDGNQSSLGVKPTRGSLQDRSASPSGGRTGMETAMGALADQLHKPTFRGRR